MEYKCRQDAWRWRKKRQDGVRGIKGVENKVDSKEEGRSLKNAAFRVFLFFTEIIVTCPLPPTVDSLGSFPFHPAS